MGVLDFISGMHLLHHIWEKKPNFFWGMLNTFTWWVLGMFLHRRIVAYRLKRARAAELALEEAAICEVEEGEAGYKGLDDTRPHPDETTPLMPTMSTADASPGDTQADEGYGGAHSGNANTMTSNMG